MKEIKGKITPDISADFKQINEADIYFFLGDVYIVSFDKWYKEFIPNTKPQNIPMNDFIPILMQDIDKYICFCQTQSESIFSVHDFKEYLISTYKNKRFLHLRIDVTSQNIEKQLRDLVSDRRKDPQVAQVIKNKRQYIKELFIPPNNITLKWCQGYKKNLITLEEYEQQEKEKNQGKRRKFDWNEIVCKADPDEIFHNPKEEESLRKVITRDKYNAGQTIKSVIQGYFPYSPQYPPKK